MRPGAFRKEPGQIIHFSIGRSVLQEFRDGFAQLRNRLLGLVRQYQCFILYLSHGFFRHCLENRDCGKFADLGIHGPENGMLGHDDLASRE